MKHIVKVTNTMSFIKKEEAPQNRFREVTYGRVVCNAREGKYDKKRTILTVNEERIKYPGYCRTSMAGLLTVKFLLNSVISTLREKIITLDIKNFYLNTTLARYEYIRMKLNSFLDDVIK